MTFGAQPRFAMFLRDSTSPAELSALRRGQCPPCPVGPCVDTGGAGNVRRTNDQTPTRSERGAWGGGVTVGLRFRVECWDRGIEFVGNGEQGFQQVVGVDPGAFRGEVDLDSGLGADFSNTAC